MRIQSEESCHTYLHVHLNNAVAAMDWTADISRIVSPRECLSIMRISTPIKKKSAVGKK